MKIFFNLIICCLLLFWSGAVMMSPMMFDAPQSTNSRSTIFMLIAIYFFPVFLFGVFRYFSATFLTISVDKILIAFAIIAVLLNIVFGIPKLLSNSLRGISSTDYTVNAKGVYYSGVKIADADPTTFKRYGTTSLDLYSHDQHHVFYGGKTLSGADPKTFMPMMFNNQDSGFWKDQNQVYYKGTALEKSNASDFTILGGLYAKSSTTVYYGSQVLNDADVKSFIFLESGLAKDKSDLYLYGKTLKMGVDLTTLRIYPYDPAIGIRFIHDAHKVYVLAIQTPQAIPDADPASFKIMERSYLKDKNHVYFYNNTQVSVITGADAASFEVLPNYDSVHQAEAKDQSHYYLEGAAIKE